MNYKKTNFKKSHIAWCDYTYNPWLGCQRISEGCRWCYMHRLMDDNNPDLVRRNSPSNFLKPYGIPGSQRIFTCSMSDFFIEEADEWRPEVWEIIKNTPQHTYLILTKRVGRIKHCLPPDWGNGYPNVMLGTSIENQKVINRMVILSKLKTPESNFQLFISAEPLLGPIDFIASQKLEEAFKLMDLIIVGGESGDAPAGTPNVKYCYRPSHSDWFVNIISQCAKYQISCFVKQLGNHGAKKLNLRDNKGGDINEWPAKFQVRQWPASKNIIEDKIEVNE